MIRKVMLAACLIVVTGCASNGFVIQSTFDDTEQPDAQKPTMLTFKKKVLFNHKLHSEPLDCNKCHKDRPGKIANFGSSFAHETCVECHLKNDQNSSCISCHRG